MRNFWLNIPRSASAVRALELSKETKPRPSMMAWYDEHLRNAALTCRRFGVSRDTFYRWRKRFEEFGPGGLENGSHRPKEARKPTWPRELERAVLELRRMAPRWGKDKLAVLLRRDGWDVSTSMVGRILTKLRNEGRLSAAPLHDPWRRPIQFKRPHGVGKPRDYLPTAPGLIVQVDTVHI